MTPEHEALARRAVACPRWRWMRGMLRLRDALGKADHGKREGRAEARDEWSYAEWPCLPDLTDPATLGCLLALVREAWSEPILSVAWAGGRWYVVQRILRSVDALRWIDTATEAEALIAALEAAP
jgi:hypothetical protein